MLSKRLWSLPMSTFYQNVLLKALNGLAFMEKLPLTFQRDKLFAREGQQGQNTAQFQLSHS